VPISTPPLNPHPFPSNWGRKRIYVLWQQFWPMRRLRRWYIPWSRTTSVQGPARPAGLGAGPQASAARIHGFMTDAAGCEPHRPSSRHWRRRLVQVEATADRRSHSSCYYYYYYVTFVYCKWQNPGRCSRSNCVNVTNGKVLVENDQVKENVYGETAE